MKCKKSLSQYLGHLQYLASKRLNELLVESGAEITSDQLRLLTLLWVEDGIPQQQLSCNASRDRASITRMVDILENQSIIVRIPDKNDRRVNLIYLTKKGKELETKAAECATKSVEEMLKGFNQEESLLFQDFLLRAIKNFSS